MPEADAGSPALDIRPARFPDDLETVRTLFREYADGLGFDPSWNL